MVSYETIGATTSSLLHFLSFSEVEPPQAIVQKNNNDFPEGFNSKLYLNTPSPLLDGRLKISLALN
jgi:hypothetical protein